MTADITLLEQRVALAAERLAQLTSENESLRQRLADVERRASEAAAAELGRWPIDATQVAVALRQTLDELRGD